MLQSGYLVEAQSRAERAQVQFSDSKWTARFRVEEAKIRLYRGESAEAIQLLTGHGKQKITDPDLVPRYGF